MVVRFDRRDAQFRAMSDAQRDVHPLPAVPERKELKEQLEELKRALPKIAEKFVVAARKQGTEKRVGFAEANDRILRLFLRTGYRDVRGMKPWFDALEREISQQLALAMRDLNRVSMEETQEQVSRVLIQEIHGGRNGIGEMLAHIDNLRAQYPDDIFCTSAGIDTVFGIDLLRATGFAWDDTTSTLEMDLVAYQAKAAGSTPEERAMIARDYGRDFQRFSRAARADAGQLMDVAHVSEREVSSLSTDDLLEIAVQGDVYMRQLERGRATAEMQDLKGFAQRVRLVARINAFNEVMGAPLMLSPAIKIRSVEGRFLGRDERGQRVDISFEDLARVPERGRDETEIGEDRKRKIAFADRAFRQAKGIETDL